MIPPFQIIQNQAGNPAEREVGGGFVYGLGRILYHRGLKQYQFHVEVYLRYWLLLPYKESMTII